MWPQRHLLFSFSYLTKRYSFLENVNTLISLDRLRFVLLHFSYVRTLGCKEKIHNNQTKLGWSNEVRYDCNVITVLIYFITKIRCYTNCCEYVHSNTNFQVNFCATKYNYRYNFYFISNGTSRFLILFVTFLTFTAMFLYIYLYSSTFVHLYIHTIDCGIVDTDMDIIIYGSPKGKIGKCIRWKG